MRGNIEEKGNNGVTIPLNSLLDMRLSDMWTEHHQKMIDIDMREGRAAVGLEAVVGITMIIMTIMIMIIGGVIVRQILGSESQISMVVGAQGQENIGTKSMKIIFPDEGWESSIIRSVILLRMVE